MPKFFNKESPLCKFDFFHPFGESSMNTRNAFRKQSQPFRYNINQGREKLIFLYSYIGLSVWNKLPGEIERTINLNTYKLNVNKFYLSKRRK